MTGEEILGSLLRHSEGGQKMPNSEGGWGAHRRAREKENRLQRRKQVEKGRKERRKETSLLGLQRMVSMDRSIQTD